MMLHSLFLVGVLSFVSLTCAPAHAGKVRTLYTNDRMMPPIFLAMGRSTVLRFDEKPKNAVIGNQNYFSIEFLGNDITIQPQGVTSTNLFIYTESQTYGLILKVGPESQYDDLVSMRWKPGYLNVENKMKRPTSLLGETNIHRTLDLKGLLHVELTKVIRAVAQGVSIFEVNVTNKTKEAISAKDVQIAVTAKNGSKPPQQFAFLLDTLRPQTKTNARILLRMEGLENMDLTLSYKNQSAKTSFTQKDLK